MPSLPEHWTNSLLGALFAIGRFNLCTALDIARIVDAQVTSEFADLEPPSVTDLTAFMRWTATMQPTVPGEDVTFLRLVLARAQRDRDEVPPNWFATDVRWCPRCAMKETHLIAHQHRAIDHCPVHHVRLRQFCDYCGRMRRYRVGQGVELWECHGCLRYPPHPYWEREDTVRLLARTVTPSPRLVAEQVLIPGLPIGADPLGAYGISPQDLRILYAQRSLPPVLQSPQSQVLRRYFRFEGHRCGAPHSTVSHEEGVHRTMERGYTLAVLSGHRCVFEPPGRRRDDELPCPCQVGFQLWAWRVHAGLFASAHRKAGIDALTYEGSHLGLCMSAAWFADAQCKLSGDHHAYRMLLRFLEPRIMHWLPVADDGEAHDGMQAGLLSHEHQWFCVPCRKGTQDVLRIRRQLDAVRRQGEEERGDVLDDAKWIMEQARARP